MRLLNKIGRLQYSIYSLLYQSVSIPRVQQGSRRVFLFGTVEHMNYGDIAITEAEKQFIIENFPDYKLIEIPERITIKSISKVKRCVADTDIIAFHGGGNMGDIWPAQEVMRQKVYEAFADKLIVSFPQSTGYSREVTLNQTVASMKKTKNLNVFLRDKKSYEFAKKNFPQNVHSFLVPDIVMSLHTDRNLMQGSEVIAFLRRDKEKLSQPGIASLINNLRKNAVNVVVSDTVDDVWHVFTKSSRRTLLEKKLSQVRKGRVIITDRLHGMIFAVITGTPVIVFDNNNHKILNFYRTWLKSVDYVSFAENFETNELSQTVRQYMHYSMKDTELQLSDKKFESLLKVLE